MPLALAKKRDPAGSDSQADPSTPAGLWAALVAIASRGLAWVKTAATAVKRAVTPEQARQVATEEYATADKLARIVVADKARALAASIERQIAAGTITDNWGAGGLDKTLVSDAVATFSPKTMWVTTLESARNAGAFQAGKADPNTRYFLYCTMLDERVRWSHRPLEAVCLPTGHEWFDIHTPPNAPNCRCYLIELSQAEFDELRGDPKVQLQVVPPDEQMIEYISAINGEKFSLPASVAPGYDFNPATPEGEARLAKMLADRLTVLRTPGAKL